MKNKSRPREPCNFLKTLNTPSFNVTLKFKTEYRINILRQKDP